MRQQNGAEKKEVYWFHEQIHVEEYPWAFKHGDPKRRIAALEMLGTLFLCNMILTHQGPLSSRVRLPVGSDNQGNVMAMLNLGSKKPYTAAILMEWSSCSTPMAARWRPTTCPGNSTSGPMS